MRPLRKLFQYVWPQWPLIVAAVSMALLVGLLQSLSIATISPLIKVMMEKRGLHGWVDRKACRYRYGIHIYEISLDGHIRLAKVDPDSAAARAGLHDLDVLLAAEADDIPADPNTDALQVLATTRASHVTLRVRTVSDMDRPADRTLVLRTPYDTLADPTAPSGGPGDRVQRGLRLWAVERLQAAVTFLPRAATPENTMRSILLIVAFSLSVTTIRCVAKFFQIYLSQKIMMVADCCLREDLFAHVLGMPVGSFTQESPSDVVSRITRDTGEMTNMLRVVFGKALREPTIALFCLMAAALIHWQLTLVFLLAGPLVIGAVAWLGRKMRKASRKSLEASAAMLGKLEETLAGLPVVKVFNRRDYEQTAFTGINRRLLKQHLRISRVDAGTPPLLEILGLAAASGALLVGVRSVSKGMIDDSDFLTLLIFLGVAAESLRRSSDIWNYVQRANAAAGRIFEIMDHPLETEAPEAAVLAPIHEQLVFDEVEFRYPSRPEPTLRGINLTIRAGENVALVGPNGSGKTTLANLVPRFYDPTRGRVLIDGTDIAGVRFRSLRGQIGLVTQNSVTFHDTIAANIAYGKPDATPAEIEAAARQAHAHDFIVELPRGYDTVIGERGTGLSGGQLQRIVIARSIIKNPAILIFDEATSQVDAESEARIHDAIERIMRHRTTLVIAHRFSTVISADKIVVIEGGRIAAQGKHEELIQTCRLYQALYETQLM